MNQHIGFSLTFAFIAVLGTTTHAENVDLSTVPSRDSVQLTIYNSEDLTLVRETRVVSFKKGLNPLQFSWANTLIGASILAPPARPPRWAGCTARRWGPGRSGPRRASGR